MRRIRTVRTVLWLLPIFVLALGVSRPSAQDPQNRARQVIQRLDGSLVEAMKGGAELGYSGRYKLLEPVITESFALPFIARVSLGKHWATLTEEQKALLLERYAEWSVATYAARFDSYSEEKFEVLPETGSYAKTVIVSSRLTTSTDVVEFHYQLMDVEGRMRIVDVKVEGVSQLALTRSQFSSIMEKEGFEGLISTLKKKTEALATGG